MAKQHNQPFRLFKRNKTWHAYFSIPTETGQHLIFRESTGATDATEATEYCLRRINEVKQAQRRKESGELEPMTVDEAFARYFEEKGQYHTNPKNVYSRLVFICKELGVTYLHEIDKQVLGRYVSQRRKTVKNATINRELAYISAVRNLANDYWEVKTNRANPLKFKLNIPAVHYQILENEDMAAKMIERAEPFLKPIIQTALYTCLRKGNILRLKWSDIDFTNDFITVKIKDKNKQGGKIHLIPILPELKAILQAQPKISEYVFTRDGKPIKDIRRAYEKIFYKEGKLIAPELPYTKFHNLRHTAITWILRATGDIYKTKEIVGHADIKTTTIYAHFLDQDKRDGLLRTFSNLHKICTNS